MIIETAVVKSISGNLVTVECQSHSACNHCHASDSCGTGTVAKAFPQRSHRLVVNKTAAVNIGDTIEIGLREKNIVTSAMLVYLLPLASILLAMALAEYFSRVLQIGRAHV